MFLKKFLKNKKHFGQQNGALGIAWGEKPHYRIKQWASVASTEDALLSERLIKLVIIASILC